MDGLYICEGEGGTGSAFFKGYNNALDTCSCYNPSTFSRKIVLKAL